MGKTAQVTSWNPLQGASSPVELVFLIDSDARASFGTQMSTISHFVDEMPPNTKMAIAYMQNGAAVFSEPLSTDPSDVLKALHAPGEYYRRERQPVFLLCPTWPSTGPPTAAPRAGSL